jgi:hypothetical protein
VPAGVVDDVVIVNVIEQVGLHVEGVRVDVAPVGRPETL